MKKATIAFFLVAIVWIISGGIPNRLREVERQQEVLKELHTLGLKLIQLSPLQREEQKVLEFLQKTELEHIAPENLQVLPVNEASNGANAYLIYREPAATYTFYLDGHATIEGD